MKGKNCLLFCLKALYHNASTFMVCPSKKKVGDTSIHLHACSVWQKYIHLSSLCKRKFFCWSLEFGRSWVIVFTAVAQRFDVTLTTYDEERRKDWKENCPSWLYFTSCHVPIFVMMSQTVLTVKNKLKNYYSTSERYFYPWSWSRI